MSVYQITTDYFCAGLEVDKNGIIVKTAPVLKNWMGKFFKDLFNYYDCQVINFGYKVVDNTNEELFK